MRTAVDVCDTVALCGVGNSIGEATGVADADFDLLVTTDSDGAITTESSPTSLCAGVGRESNPENDLDLGRCPGADGTKFARCIGCEGCSALGTSRPSVGLADWANGLLTICRSGTIAGDADLDEGICGLTDAGLLAGISIGGSSEKEMGTGPAELARS